MLANLQTAFIKQEALEKAREIKVKADEEFAIEKVSAVSASFGSLPPGPSRARSGDPRRGGPGEAGSAYE